METIQKQKKRLIGILPKDVTYNVISVKHQSLENSDIISETCQNCNKAINNIALVEDQNGKQYNVGLDCAATLKGMNLSELEIWNENIKTCRGFRTSILNYQKKNGKDN